MQRSDIELQPTISDPLADAYAVGPRVYRLQNYPSSVIRMIDIGCQGEEDSKQMEVAGLMSDVVAKTINDLPEDERESAWYLNGLSGDNFYPGGVKSPTDTRFESQFYKPYRQGALTSIPFTVLPGNHDYNFHKVEEAKTFAKATIKAIPVVSWLVQSSSSVLVENPKGEKAIMQEVAHTYTPQASDKVANKAEFFGKDRPRNEIVELDYQKAPKYIMPFPFYSIIIGKLQIFYIDSNTLVKEWYEYIEHLHAGAKLGRYNQFEFLQREFQNAKKAGRTIIFKQHHPLFDCDKRAYPAGWDGKNYFTHTSDPDFALKKIDMILQVLKNKLDQEHIGIIIAAKNGLELQELAGIVTPSDRYGQYGYLLTNIYQHYALQMDLLVCAHFHAGAYYNNRSNTNPAKFHYAQVVAGNGGASLHDRKFFRQQKHLGYFLRNHGCTMLTCDTENPSVINIEIFLLNKNYSLKFTNLSAEPILSPTNSVTMQKLSSCVLNICRHFLSDLKDLSHGSTATSLFTNNYINNPVDLDIIHLISVYFSQANPLTFETALYELKKMTDKLVYREHPKSFLSLINKKITESFSMSLDELCAKTEKPRSRPASPGLSLTQNS